MKTLLAIVEGTAVLVTFGDGNSLGVAKVRDADGAFHEMRTYVPLSTLEVGGIYEFRDIKEKMYRGQKQLFCQLFHRKTGEAKGHIGAETFRGMFTLHFKGVMNSKLVADSIFAKYGANGVLGAMRSLLEQKTSADDFCKGIDRLAVGSKSVDKLMSGLQQFFHQGEECRIISFMSQAGLGRTVYTKIRDVFSRKDPRNWTNQFSEMENPYVLTIFVAKDKICCIDKLAKSLEKGDPKKYAMSRLWRALQTLMSNSGDTVMREPALVTALANEVELDRTRVAEFMETFPNMVVRVGCDGMVARRHIDHFEQEVADFFNEMVKKPSVLAERYQNVSREKLRLDKLGEKRPTDEQMEVVRTIFTNSVALVLGPAGSGKSTTTCAAVASLMQIEKSQRPVVYCLGFMGMVAKRIKRLLSEAGLDQFMFNEDPDIRCKTIHSYINQRDREASRDANGRPLTKEERLWNDFMKCSGADDSFATECGEPETETDDPAPSKRARYDKRPRVYIVDEFSTISLELFHGLLTKIRHGVDHLVLIGDEHQMPSSKRGQLIRDVRGLVPTVRLTTVSRAGGNLLDNCTRIRNGEPLDLSHPSICRLHEVPGDVVECLVHRYAQVMDEDPSGTRIILCRNVDDCVTLNRAIRDVENPLKAGQDQVEVTWPTKDNDVRMATFRVGDKILCQNNTYAANPVRYNGDTGQVEWIKRVGVGGDGTSVVCVNFDDGTPADHNRKGEKANSWPTGRILFSTRGDDRPLTELSHGYAITVSKSQGSEYSNVLLYLNKRSEGYPIYGSPVVYTGATRAKRRLDLFCRSKRSLEDEYKHSPKGRDTYLVQRILGGR